MQDVAEFFSHETYGLRKISKSWKKIKKRIESGSEQELKLAIIEADDFLYETMQDNDYKGDNFEQMLKNAGKKVASNEQELLEAHAIRNAIVYDPGYRLEIDKAKRILFAYETAVKNVAISQ